MNTFHLEGRPFVTLNNLLKIEGWCDSGAAAKHAIDEGHVTVDGKVELRKRNKIVANQVVRFAGRMITVME
jgi:ribosome-associated protein